MNVNKTKNLNDIYLSSLGFLQPLEQEVGLCVCVVCIQGVDSERVGEGGEITECVLVMKERGRESCYVCNKRGKSK